MCRDSEIRTVMLQLASKQATTIFHYVLKAKSAASATIRKKLTQISNLFITIFFYLGVAFLHPFTLRCVCGVTDWVTE